MKAMIFAAGLGTRLKPLTDTMPKALVPLAGKPLLQWQVEKLLQAGITDITVNVHHFADQIIEAVSLHQGWGASIHISDEREQLLDTGGGVWKVMQSLAEEALLICNVDILSNISVSDVIQTYAMKPQGSLLVVSERSTQRYLCFDSQQRLCGWTNIATGEQKGQDGQHLAYSGMAVLHPSLRRFMAAVEQEKGCRFSLMDVYLKAMKDVVLEAYIPQHYCMMDVGKIDQIQAAEQFAEHLTN